MSLDKKHSHPTADYKSTPLVSAVTQYPKLSLAAQKYPKLSLADQKYALVSYGGPTAHSSSATALVPYAAGPAALVPYAASPRKTPLAPRSRKAQETLHLIVTMAGGGPQGAGVVVGHDYCVALSHEFEFTHAKVESRSSWAAGVRLEVRGAVVATERDKAQGGGAYLSALSGPIRKYEPTYFSAGETHARLRLLAADGTPVPWVDKTSARQLTVHLHYQRLPAASSAMSDD